MQHIAIMKKNWGLIDKILSGKKTIESRWYVNKIAPWGKVNVGEKVYFKDSGESVTAVATVDKVLYFAKNLEQDLFDNVEKFDSNLILEKYGTDICIQNISGFNEHANSKNYCILMFLKDAKKIEPFKIDKTGFGNSCAWMCVKDIEKIRL